MLRKKTVKPTVVTLIALPTHLQAVKTALADQSQHFDMNFVRISSTLIQFIVFTFK